VGAIWDGEKNPRRISGIGRVSKTFRGMESNRKEGNLVEKGDIVLSLRVRTRGEKEVRFVKFITQAREKDLFYKASVRGTKDM